MRTRRPEGSRGESPYRPWQLPPPAPHETKPFLLTFAASGLENEFDAVWKRETVARDLYFLKVLGSATAVALVRHVVHNVGWEFRYVMLLALLLFWVGHTLRTRLCEDAIARWRFALVMFERLTMLMLHSYTTVRLIKFQKSKSFEFLMMFMNFSGVGPQFMLSLGLPLKFSQIGFQFLGSFLYIYVTANNTCSRITSNGLGDAVDWIMQAAEKVGLGFEWSPDKSLLRHPEGSQFYSCLHLFTSFHLMFTICFSGYLICMAELKRRESFMVDKVARGELEYQKVPSLVQNMGFPGMLALNLIIPPYFVAILWFLGGATVQWVASYGLQHL